MNTQTARWLLRSLAITLLIGSVSVITWGVASSRDSADHVNNPAIPRRASARSAELVSSPPLEKLASVWGKALRRPLYDPPKEPKKTNRGEKKDAKKKKRGEGKTSEGPVRLVGTMLEDGRSIAVFMNSNGKIDMRGVGENLELAPGTRLVRIDQTEVTLSNQGRATTLRLSNTKAR